MLKIYTSYFYQLRFMKPNMIPLSTARYDPAWFHQNKGQNYQWKDKNGVWNGLRAPMFAPGSECEGLCYGAESCDTHDPTKCLFLKTYRYQLDQLDFNDIINRCKKIAEAIQLTEKFEDEPIIVFIVHEATDNPCSERRAIQEWFAANGVMVNEWKNNR